MKNCRNEKRQSPSLNGKGHMRRILSGLTALFILAPAVLTLGGCGNDSAAETSNRLGEEAFAKGRYDEALVAFEQAASEDGTVAKYYSNQALAYLKLGDDEAAMEQLQKALSVSTQEKEVYRALGIAYMQQGDYEQALEAFDNATNLATLITDPVDYDVLEYRAEAQMLYNKPIAASETYTALIGLKWNLSENYFRRAMARLARPDLDDEIRQAALDDFTSAVDAAGDGDFALLIDIYYILNGMGDNDHAMEYVNRALEAARNDSERNLANGEIYYFHGAYQDAIKAFLQVDDLWERSGACLTLAASYADSGDYAGAAEVYEKCIETFGSDVRLLNELAVCEIEQEKYNLAINHLQQATAQVDSMDLPKIRWNLVIAYEKSGQDELAYATLTSYLERYPQDRLAIEEYNTLMKKLSGQSE